MNNFYFFLSKILNPVLNPSNFLFLLLIFLFVLYVRSKNKFIFKLFSLNFLIIILIAFLPIGIIGLNYLEKDFKLIKKYDDIKNIVVLSGSDKRIISSIELANNYKEANIYYVGVYSFIGKKNSFYDYIPVEKFYKNLNFDMKRIKFIGKSRNTIENLNDIKNLNLKDKETILLTSAYHMKRSMIIAKKKNINFLPYAVDITPLPPKSFLDIFNSFNVVNNMAKFNLFIREIVGIIAFKLFF